MSKRVQPPNYLSDTSAAMRAVSTSWALIYAATYRNLRMEEREELRGLSDLFARAMTNLPEFNKLAKAVNERLRSSEVLEGQHEIVLLDELLQDLYALRDCLDLGRR